MDEQQPERPQVSGEGLVDSVDPADREVDALLREDATRLGDVYRLDYARMNQHEIAVALGVPTSGFVGNIKATIAAFRDSAVPKSPTLSAQIAGRVRTWLKNPDLSPGLRERLVVLHDALEMQAADSTAITIEEVQAKRATDEVEQANTPGIYVYTLPHYLRHPYAPDGRTLLKVGRSERDTYQRAYAQGRITALPEDPILLRVYAVDAGETSAAERDFHSWLADADHERSRSLRGGSEWFVTSTKFLDRIAEARRLRIVFSSELQAGEA